MNSKTIGAALLGSCLLGGLSAAEVRDFAKYVTLTVGESAVAEGTLVVKGYPFCVIIK